MKAQAQFLVSPAVSALTGISTVHLSEGRAEPITWRRLQPLDKVFLEQAETHFRKKMPNSYGFRSPYSPYIHVEQIFAGKSKNTPTHLSILQDIRDTLKIRDGSQTSLIPTTISAHSKSLTAVIETSIFKEIQSSLEIDVLDIAALGQIYGSGTLYFSNHYSNFQYRGSHKNLTTLRIPPLSSTLAGGFILCGENTFTPVFMNASEEKPSAQELHEMHKRKQHPVFVGEFQAFFKSLASWLKASMLPEDYRQIFSECFDRLCLTDHEVLNLPEMKKLLYAVAEAKVNPLAQKIGFKTCPSTLVEEAKKEILRLIDCTSNAKEQDIEKLDLYFKAVSHLEKIAREFKAKTNTEYARQKELKQPNLAMATSRNPKGKNS